MKTLVKTALLLLLASSVFTACNTYELTRYKGTEIDKVGDIAKYKVYIHAKNGTYKVDKPALTPAGISGSITKLTDQATIEEITSPRKGAQEKRHKHDLNLFTKVAVSDTADVILKKADITDVAHVVAKSTGLGKKIGNTVAAVVVSAIGIGLIVGIVLAFQ